MKLPTGSKVHLVWKCPASAVLPQVESPEKHEPARRRGKQIHRYLERVRVVGEETAIAEQPRELWHLLKAIDIDELPTNLATEVSLAWNWRARTARLLGYNLDRDYRGVDWSCEIPMTLDIVGTSATMFLDADYKTGHTRLPAPDLYGQTLLGACAVRAWTGIQDGLVQLIYIHSDGSHHKVTRTVNSFDLDDFEVQLQRSMLMANAADNDPARADVNEGEWCEHCPAYKSCPAKVALVRAIPEELRRLGVTPGAVDGPLEVDSRQITVARAAQYWTAIERIENALDRIKQEIIGFASFGDIELPDGRVIGLVETERRQLDGRLAAQVLERRYGPEAAAEAVELRCSVEAFTSAIAIRKQPGQVAQSKKGTGIVDLAFKELEELGGITIKTTSSVKPHQPRKKLAVVK